MKDTIDRERRRYPRTVVRPGIFVHLNSGADVLGEALNVSEGGLAMEYLEGPGEMPDRARLRLFATGGIVYLTAAPVRVVCDIERRIEMGLSAIRIRQVGMAFERLSAAEAAEVQRFIRENKL